MIATHNIKVNGVWYRAGEEYPAPELEKAAEPEVPVAEPVAEEVKVVEEKPEEVKPKTTSRRKTSK